ncbi:hypothetical protein, partial [Mycobacterium avium]|uniref:hypothetical protein n=1 Tax=Mycobacterium avium TaxID=1764 RepID=UPI0012DA054B
MADPSGFLKYTHRELPKRRPVPLRLRDWREVYEEFDHGDLLAGQLVRRQRLHPALVEGVV